LTAHRRQFTDTPWTDSLIGEIHGARGRRLEQALNKPASLTFTVDGHSDAATMVQELQTDVIAWRWRESWGTDVPWFRGVVAQSEDQLGDSHSVTFTCHDYSAVMARRYLTQARAYTQADQDTIVSGLVDLAGTNMAASGGTPFVPGSYLPLTVSRRAPDGTGRLASGVLRDRAYTAQSSIGDLVTQLGAVIGGFDADVVPAWHDSNSITRYDYLRVFYPVQGVDRSDVILEWGGNVVGLTRSVNSADYANYARIVGAAPVGASTDTPPMFSEFWNGDANDVTRVPVGLWQSIDNASDVSIQSTLDEKARGDVDVSGVLIPSYTIALRPGTFSEGFVNMGDNVGLVVRSGRLNVVSLPPDGGVRVVGMAFDISEDGPEVVTLTVGRPLTSLVDMMRAGSADVAALARR
jgi:hypothetical protein